MSDAATRALLVEALGLKAVDRAGWLRVGVPRPESVAAHSWGMALLALLDCPEELDRERVLALCIVHDLPEVRVGDITPHDGLSKAAKAAREAAAADALLAAHPALRALVAEYAAGESAEARYVRALDKVDMALQAEVYAAAGHPTAEFVRSARARLGRHRLAALLPPTDGAVAEGSHGDSDGDG